MPVGPITHDYVNPVRGPDCRLDKTIFFLSFLSRLLFSLCCLIAYSDNGRFGPGYRYRFRVMTRHPCGFCRLCGADRATLVKARSVKLVVGSV